MAVRRCPACGKRTRAGLPAGVPRRSFGARLTAVIALLIWTFTRVEGVEPTNNGAERALRPAVLWRKGSFGSDSQVGSRFAERLLTVVATCRQQGRPLLDFLVAAGEAALRGSAPPSLLPARAGT
jgi:transposase